MSLREQMSLHRAQPLAASDAAGPAHSSVRDAYQKLRRDIHLAVLERVELERLSRLHQDQIRMEIGALIARILDEERLPANDIERRSSRSTCTTRCSASARSKRCCATPAFPTSS